MRFTTSSAGCGTIRCVACSSSRMGIGWSASSHRQISPCWWDHRNRSRSRKCSPESLSLHTMHIEPESSLYRKGEHHSYLYGMLLVVQPGIAQAVMGDG